MRKYLKRGRCSVYEINKSSRIFINISGSLYETHLDTLQRFPDTLLGDWTKRLPYFNTSRGEFFFERSRLFFDAILFFYQSKGMLECPPGVKLELFLEECRFFQLPPEAILRLEERHFKCIRREVVKESRGRLFHSYTFKSKLWDILEKPKTSKAAMMVSSVSLSAVFLSVVLSCLQTLPQIQHKDHGKDPWSVAELALNSCFLVELILRVCSTPNLAHFFKSVTTIIDMITILPYFIVLIIGNEKVHKFDFLRMIRILRVGRLLQFSKSSERITLVGKILLSCMGDFNTLLLCIFMIVMLSGSLMFYLEDDGRTDGVFTTIPVSMYWAIQTLFTVGYGDLVPRSLSGKVFGGAFMLVGASSICIPLLSIIAKFQAEWSPVLHKERTKKGDKHNDNDEVADENDGAVVENEKRCLKMKKDVRND